MARYRSLSQKIRYGKMLKRNNPVPSWCVIRTNRKFKNHPKRRQWRKTRIKR